LCYNISNSSGYGNIADTWYLDISGLAGLIKNHNIMPNNFNCFGVSMAKEIERKFLVKDLSFKSLARGILFRQGYLSKDSGITVRVRIVEDRAYLTIKGPSTGFSRLEYEYDIPVKDADEMLEKLCRKPIIEKYRYKVEYKGFTWEIDEFLKENEGLIVAEIELESEDQDFPVPGFIGEEVTFDRRYRNSYLASHPYKSW